MKITKIFSLVFLSIVTFGFAQDALLVKKVVDAEQYDKAKSLLKSILKTSPSDGRSNFILGNIYLTQSVIDSAKIAFQKGLTGTDGKRLNYVGLGSIDLDNGNIAGAEANFATALKDMRKKDIEELIAIGRAYTNAAKPDYKKALEYLNKAKTINLNDAQVQLALGDAFFGDKNQNEAYAAYRNAFQFDPSLLRAKMQLGVLLKGAKSYDEAIRSFDEVIAIDANYGPVYRELAETYYKWGRNKPSKEEANMQLAFTNYEKYMNLTDQSIHSRMRRADFLILLKKYKELEEEANKMIEIDKVNPRIFRYLGYSAYENGNIDVAIKSLENFISNPANKVIGKDHFNLGLSKFKKGLNADGLSIDPTVYNAAIENIRKAIVLDSTTVEELNEVGKKMFTAKLYKEAISVFELGTTNKAFKNYADDNIYYGLALYAANNKRDVTPDLNALKKSDEAFGNVIAASPSYADAYLYRARVNNLLKNDAMSMKYYEDYIAKVTEKGPSEMAKPTVVKKIIESYNNIAANLADTDKVKAIEYFTKTLAIDPANVYANESINKLK
jgi:Tfp pilus assembly protein PilF